MSGKNDPLSRRAAVVLISPEAHLPFVRRKSERTYARRNSCPHSRSPLARAVHPVLGLT